MSSTRRDARGARFDEAIDRAVREMLDVEPPAGLRGRVLDRIGRPTENFVASAFRRKAVWLAAPLAAAAILVLAVLIPSESDRPIVAPPKKAASDLHLVAPPLGLPASQTRPTVVARAGARPPRAQQSIAAATLPADSPFEGAQVEALAGPRPIAIDRLSGPPPPSVSDVSVAPIQIRALEVSALTETPPERREE